ncbi:MAG: hypothetical protein WDZ69_02740 [Candidatus Pacearchaeota archaeon]
MPTQDTSEIKNKIISTLRRNGPSLPVHIAKSIESSILFTSAFLSELLSEKKVKTSNMRVGSSSLYFLSGQEHLLEKFSHHLKSKEKEAHDLLKGKEILKDSEQEPSIRVALREIKDFAIPFKKNEEIFWRFFNVPENKSEEEKQPEKETEKTAKETPHEEKHKEKEPTSNNSLDIFDKKTAKKKVVKKKSGKKKTRTTQKESDFFKKIKEFLSEESIELLDILNFGKKEILLRVRKNSQEKVLIAYNKKRINEKDILNASKKTKEFGLPYIIISKGEPLKKTSELIEALKNLNSIEKLK